ncbi:response regulator [Desulfurispirillum indicum]|uniref:Response regulator receiver n=1 Tax=Desulfurispirillum indicum (strain ATCC BAA-1389 / DSM 22839 / S5) TaxID=653733 RepID=E6W5S4_DESIS|nr:response regulator [Desulfurispirillum indicum]ADU67209.1 response regulator receiver [Desulfurispirillum indicum S5]UCZ56555.1 response regulator [Desulfurispirillum indicum]
MKYFIEDAPVPMSISAREVLRSQLLLFAEDDDQTRQMFLPYFSAIFQRVLEAQNGIEALEMYQIHQPPVMVVDIDMPYLSGLELIKKLRRENANCRIIITSAYTDQRYLLDAVELDISRYLVKPIFKNDLDTALEKVAREIAGELGKAIGFGDGWQYDPATRCLSLQGTIIDLTPLERQLLHLLITNSHRVVEYAEIENRVWCDRDMTHDALKSVVRELRRKVGRSCILNVSGTGYRFCDNGGTS